MENLLSTVFISYNWETDKCVDTLCEKLKGKAVVERDKQSIESWGKLSKFMESIREQDIAVLFISEKYLRSDNCLYEVTQLMKDDNWVNRTRFIVMDNAKEIYTAEGRGNLIKYWYKKCEELAKIEDEMPEIELNMRDLKNRQIYLHNMDEFLGIVADTINPDIEEAIEKIIQLAEGQIDNVYKEISKLIKETQNNTLEWKCLEEYANKHVLEEQLWSGQIDYGVNGIRYHKSYFTRMNGREYFLMEVFHGDPAVTSPNFDTRVLMKAEASGLHQYVEQSIAIPYELITLQLWIGWIINYNATKNPDLE